MTDEPIFFDYNLKFISKEDAEQKLVQAGILAVGVISKDILGTEKDVPYRNSVVGYAVDELGILQAYDPDPEDGVSPTFIDGWHVNIRCVEDLTDEQKAILPIIPKPRYPKRVWA